MWKDVEGWEEDLIRLMKSVVPFRGVSHGTIQRQTPETGEHLFLQFTTKNKVQTRLLIAENRTPQELQYILVVQPSHHTNQVTPLISLYLHPHPPPPCYQRLSSIGRTKSYFTYWWRVCAPCEKWKVACVDISTKMVRRWWIVIREVPLESPWSGDCNWRPIRTISGVFGSQSSTHAYAVPSTLHIPYVS